MYTYIEHEELVGVKMAVHYNGHDNYHVQLVDGVDCFYNQEGLSGEQVVKVGKGYGFEISNPNLCNGLVEFQYQAF